MNQVYLCSWPRLHFDRQCVQVDSQERRPDCFSATPAGKRGVPKAEHPRAKIQRQPVTAHFTPTSKHSIDPPLLTSPYNHTPSPRYYLSHWYPSHSFPNIEARGRAVMFQSCTCFIVTAVASREFPWVARRKHCGDCVSRVNTLLNKSNWALE